MKNKVLSSFFKKQIFAICSCLVILVFGTILISSALFTKTAESSLDGPQEITTGVFAVNFAQGQMIDSDVYISSDTEGVESNGYTFSVKNNGNIDLTYEILLTNKNINCTNGNGETTECVDSSYIKYSIDGENGKILANEEVKNSTSEKTIYRIKINNLKPTISKEHNLRIWIDDVVDTEDVINKSVNLSIQVQAIVSNDVGSDLGTLFDYSGSLQEYTIPVTGTYTITAVGAEGAVGNKYGNLSSTLKGGKGAKISADFNLEKGDKISIVVGGMGQTTTGTATDGTAGAGGGGAFIYKKISSLDSAKSGYQFTKNSEYYEVLLVAAGGSGTGDLGYSSSKTYAGYDANAVNFYSPSNFAAYSTTTGTTTGSNAYSIKQFIDNNSAGGNYTRGSSVCKGAYGGGGCNDDSRGVGGGWLATSYTSYSWSLGENTVGVNGINTGNGYVIIKLKR